MNNDFSMVKLFGIIVTVIIFSISAAIVFTWEKIKKNKKEKNALIDRRTGLYYYFDCENEDVKGFSKQTSLRTKLMQSKWQQIMMQHFTCKHLKVGNC